MQISLHELQLWLKWVIVDPRGVRKALKNLHPKKCTNPDRYQAPEKSAYHLIENNKERINRLSVYAEGYFVRLVEALENDFPVTKQLLGEDDFLKFIAEYLKNYPSYTRNIAEVGKNLPIFAHQYPFQKKQMYLPALILFEWKLVESFYADDMPALNVSLLSKLSAQNVENIKIRFDTSVYLLNFEWPIHRLWKQRNDKNFISIQKKFKQKKTFLCIYRDKSHVDVLELSSQEFNVMFHLKNGFSLGEAMQRLSVNSANQVKTWFSRWMAHKLFFDLY